ncbi:uncharacterized protein LOC123446476 isoform X2 [Hordeum vulgare subsp. vulgare]|uniref:uncharacterized protein LOC123446476 isoform X2 n=1 Tax=Hordeum vulgare subsp. vulgare TaxID=112509 RepID=UPI001D1A4FA7|nr:uncharacterized protein LOC123446476 isoform X2 [Hordeum vulgare subsp. vulgare]
MERICSTSLKQSTSSSLLTCIGPEIVNYDGFYISLNELVDYMKPLQWLSSMVIQIAIIHIIKNLPQGSREVIMPLRLSLQQGMYNVPHINKIFKYKNRLDKQDMVMLSVLECSDPNHPEEGTHYWVFNVNLRDE